MSAKVYKIECFLRASYAELLLTDLFEDRFMYGWGKYVKQVSHGEPEELLFHWAETMSGRRLEARQIDAGTWFFRADFPEGSLQFAWEINGLIAVYKAESIKRGDDPEIKVFRQPDLNVSPCGGTC